MPDISASLGSSLVTGLLGSLSYPLVLRFEDQALIEETRASNPDVKIGERQEKSTCTGYSALCSRGFFIIADQLHDRGFGIGHIYYRSRLTGSKFCTKQYTPDHLFDNGSKCLMNFFRNITVDLYLHAL